MGQALLPMAVRMYWSLAAVKLPVYGIWNMEYAGKG
jgi:hypothetical protein